MTPAPHPQPHLFFIRNAMRCELEKKTKIERNKEHRQQTKEHP